MTAHITPLGYSKPVNAIVFAVDWQCDQCGKRDHEETFGLRSEIERLFNRRQCVECIQRGEVRCG